MINFFFACHDALKNYRAPKLCTVYVVKSPVLGFQRAPENSELAPSVLVLSDLFEGSILTVTSNNSYTFSKDICTSTQSIENYLRHVEEIQFIF